MFYNFQLFIYLSLEEKGMSWSWVGRRRDGCIILGGIGTWHASVFLTLALPLDVDQIGRVKCP